MRKPKTYAVLLEALRRRTWFSRLRPFVSELMLPMEHNIIVNAIDSIMSKQEGEEVGRATLQLLVEDMVGPEVAPDYEPIFGEMREVSLDDISLEVLGNFLDNRHRRSLAKQALEDDISLAELSRMAERSPRSIILQREMEITDYRWQDSSYHNGALSPKPTGLSPILDEYCSISPGEIAIVESQTNGGKTCTLVNIAANCVEGGGFVVFLTLDDPPFKIQRRFDQRFLGKTRDEVDRSPSQGERAREIVASLGGRLEILDGTCRAGGYRPEDLDAALEDRGSPDLLLVDYADKMHYRDRFVEQDVALVYDELQRIGSRRKVPMWTGSQVRRMNYGFGKVELDSVAWSIAKNEKAAAIMAIMSNEETDRAGMVYVRILKTREGRPESRDVPLDVDWSRQTMKEYK